MDCGPGSDPQLHRNTRTYCQCPVLSAEFIPSENVRPPLCLHLLLFELKGRVYGQVLSERQQWRFPEHPVSEFRARESTYDIEFESRDHYDPLVTLVNTIDGLRNVAARMGGFSPILGMVEVIDKDYVEAGKDIVNTFGTPLSTLEGELAGVDRLSSTIAEPQRMGQRRTDIV